jgi:hypothetical protein
MKNITYMIGAGASANSLPVLNKIRERFDFFKQDLVAFRQNNNDYEKDVTDLLLDLNWVISQTSNHQTIDTFARKLFVKESRHSELIRFKRVLSCYFVYEQTKTQRNAGHPNEISEGKVLYKQLPDMRYDSLISTLTSNEVDNWKLKDNIKILSWNYDVQFELAYLRFWELEKLCNVSKKLQIIPSNSVLNWPNKTINLNEFAYIHLNGVIGYDNPLEDNAANLIELFHDRVFIHDDVISEVLNFNRKMIIDIEKEKRSPGLMFFNYAWEYFANKEEFRGKLSRETIENALEVAKKTDVLVVIGYSFPSFNREIDKLIIDNMSNLRKVYIQDLHPDKIQDILENGFERIKEFVASYPSIKFFYKQENLNQFVIPMEIWE